MTFVTLEYTLKFRNITNKDAEKVTLENKATIEQLLKYLKDKYGEEFEKEFTNPSGDKVSGTPLILLNGRALNFSGDLNIYIKNGDTITFTYAIVGG